MGESKRRRAALGAGINKTVLKFLLTLPDYGEYYLNFNEKINKSIKYGEKLQDLVLFYGYGRLLPPVRPTDDGMEVDVFFGDKNCDQIYLATIKIPQADGERLAQDLINFPGDANPVVVGLVDNVDRNKRRHPVTGRTFHLLSGRVGWGDDIPVGKRIGLRVDPEINPEIDSIIKLDEFTTGFGDKDTRANIPETRLEVGEHPDLLRFSVGQPGPEEHLKSIPPEGCVIANIDTAFLKIIIAEPNMKQNDCESLKNNPAHIGILKHGDSLFLLLLIDGYGTFDMPYDHSLVPTLIRGLPAKEPKQGLSFVIFIYDSISRLALGFRHFTITPEFCAVLEAELNRLEARISAADWDYAGSAAEAYRRWPTPEAMMQAALYVEPTGMAFPGQGPKTAPPPAGH